MAKRRERERNEGQDPRLAAAFALLGRTGAKSAEVRYQDDQQPVVWLAVATWRVDETGRPVPQGGTQTHDAAGAMTPLKAVIRLLEQTMDGGTCTHCGRPTGVSDDFTETLPLPDQVCWYQYDPELATFRRACEGEGATGG